MTEIQSSSDAIKLIGMNISTISLYILLAVFLLSEKFHNLPGRNLTSLCISWIGFYTINLLFDGFNYNCPNSDLLLKLWLYFMINGFAWNFIISYDTWRTVRMSFNKCVVSKGSRWKRFCAYSIFAWIFPILLVKRNNDYSWATQSYDYDSFNIYAFSNFLTDSLIFPIIMLIVSNFIFSVSSLYRIWRNKYYTRNMQRSTETKFIEEFNLLMKFILIGGLIPILCTIFACFELHICVTLLENVYAYQGFILTLLFITQKDIIRSISPRNRISSLIFKNWQDLIPETTQR